MAASKKKASQKDLLLAELDKLAPQLDEEGLGFLIQQATTLIYNRKVDELNKSREVATRSRKPAQEKAQEKEAPKSAEVFFEAGKKQSTFFMDVQGKRAILDQNELMRMVKIAQSAETKPAAEERVYRWLKNNRDDVLFDCGIHPKDRKIAALCDRLQNDFSIRED